MPKWLRAIVLGVAALVLLVAGVLAAVFASQPTSYRITRRAVVPCTVATLTPKVTDVRELDGWMSHHPDPHDPPSVSFSPVTTGQGAWVERQDSRSVGRLELEQVTNSQARLKSTTSGNFGGGQSTLEISWAEKSEGTEVELAVSGSLEGLRRALWPLVNLEGRVGPSLDDSLGRLRARCP